MSAERDAARLGALDHQIEVTAARVEGLNGHVAALTEGLTDLAKAIARMTSTIPPLADKARSREDEVRIWNTVDERKVWVVRVRADNEYRIPECEVLIEQFGDAEPTIAFRRESHHSWGRPYRGVAG